MPKLTDKFNVVEASIEEEQSKDEETEHVAESVGYMFFRSE